MNHGLAHFSDRLREARIAKNLSQRDLSKLAGVPQSHISKIESNQVDLRLSSLIALANALDLEVSLVPRKAMPAVRSISRQAARATPAPQPAATEVMRSLQDKLHALQIKLPVRPELDAARKAYAALKPLQLDSGARCSWRGQAGLFSGRGRRVMAGVSTLTVRLYSEAIGTLTHVGGERTLFAFNDAYINDPGRAALPRRLVMDTARETVALFMQRWAGEKHHLPMDQEVKLAIDKHLETLPILTATRG